MKKNNKNLGASQIRISKENRDLIKIYAVKVGLSMEDMANLIISKGIAVLKK